ncbi:ceramide kinase-like isoform X1 [Amphibalanus amphitrite]|uniref:ceramide kinase-like isoform X1 n=1 Tax=Amphibalanus amphitrite TaxID=1232801 RepID=UPI001C910AEE|nr:ceramide kinase-like isoform X1 [Amphibalanus amphitrite]
MPQPQAVNQNGASHPIRQGYFQINSVRHKVSIGENYVAWEPEGAPDLRHAVRLCDVVAVSRPAGGGPRGSSVYQVPVAPPDCSIPAPNTCGKAFAVHYAERVGRRWKLRVQHFHQKNIALLQPWVDQLQSLLNGEQRPRRLLVIINPTCGSRKAPNIYTKKVQPIFTLAGVQTEVVQTTHAGHALTMLRRCSLHGQDGVVVVGGDGTLMEALNGLLTRPSPDGSDRPPCAPLPIGVIPAGSTDAVCGSVGTADPVTAALLIVMGVTRWVDVCSLRTAGQLLRYSLSMITYGFFGDVLQDSEKLRWLGPMRYNVAGAGRFWRSRAYRGSVAFRTAPGAMEPHKPCFADCDVCLREPVEAEGETQGQNDGEWHRVSGPFLVVSSANVSCRCKITPEGMCPRAHLSDGWAHLILVRQTSRANFLRYMYRSAAGKAPFDLPFVEYYRVKEFELLPESTGDDQRLLGEAHINLAMSVDSTAAGGEWRAPERTAAADTAPAGRRPLDSVWNCDGEVVADPAVNLRVHPRAIRLFGRGVERLEEGSGCCGCGRRTKKQI